MKKRNVTLSLVILDPEVPEDAPPDHATYMTWNGIPDEALLLLEGKLLEAIASLNDYGKQQTSGKPPASAK